MSGLFTREHEPPDHATWRKVLVGYGYGSTDELDALVIEGVSVGYFRGDELRAVARTITENLIRSRRQDSFSKAWDLFHAGLATDDDEILDAIFVGGKENLIEITPLNMNSAVCLLRKFGRDAQASELVREYVKAHQGKPEFFARWNLFLRDSPLDPVFQAAMEEQRAAIVDARDPAEMLKQMAKTGGCNPEEDVPLLSRLSADELVQLFYDHAADNVKELMHWADRLASLPGAEVLRVNLDDALRRIAAKSQMRAERLRSWGVLPNARQAEQANPSPANEEGEHTCVTGCSEQP